MSILKINIIRTEDFNHWLNSQTDVTQSFVLARLQRIALDAHFGFVKYFDGLIELKWKSGLRVYIAKVDQNVVVVLGGGNKNGQSKDIEQAKKILSQIKKSSIRSS